MRKLIVTRYPRSSSFFRGDPEIGSLFDRSDYAVVDEELLIDTLPLDEAASRYKIDKAAFLKIDIEGAEHEVFRSAPKLLSGPLLGVRCEVSFFSIRPEQPLYPEIQTYLNDHGFLPMGFEELHEWRRRTRIKHALLAPGPIPYSRGQIIHGDMVFLRHPERMESSTEEGIEALLRAAFFALLYDYVDHAASILKRPAVKNYLTSIYKVDVDAELSQVTTALFKIFRRRLWRNRPRGLVSSFRRRLRAN